MNACARRCRESYYFLAKLSLGPAHQEWEAAEGTPETRSGASSATWGWPTAREGQGHGGVIVVGTREAVTLYKAKDSRESA